MPSREAEEASARAAKVIDVVLRPRDALANTMLRRLTDDSTHLLDSLDSLDSLDPLATLSL